MAILRGPLLSLSASGTIADSITYATWKGIKYARQRVVPANPNTAGQQAQRGYVTTAVALWHSITAVLNEFDKTALNLAASVSGTVMSGFNYFVKARVKTLAKSVSLISLWDQVISLVGSNTFTLTVRHLTSTAACAIRYGTSPTTMMTVQARDQAGTPGTHSTFTIVGLSPSTKYYFKAYCTTTDSEEDLGIGTQVTTA